MHDYKELIKGFTKEDFESGRVNLHIHTTYSDGKADFIEVSNNVKKYKLLSVTDHNTMQGYLDNPDNELLTGVEFDVWYKYIFLHLLAYGVDVNHSALTSFFATTKQETELDVLRFFAKRNIKDLIDSIHAAGGIAVLAHPCCCWALNLEQFISDLVDLGLDGVEVYYPYPRWRKYIKFSSPDSVEAIAEKYHLLKTGGTDLHSKFLD